MPLAAAALALAFAALPPFEQYTLESFPRALQHELRGSGIWQVRRLPAGAEGKLWILGQSCGELGCRRTLLFLQQGKGFRKVGEARGEVVEAAGGEAGLPGLTIERRLQGGRLERFDLAFANGAYVAGAAAKLVVDPLTGAEVPAAKLDQSAEDDFVAGSDASAAGRWAALCAAGCTPAQHAKEGRAALRAQLFPQAEKALRLALKADPSLAEARLDLGDALAAQGKLGEARSAYEAASRLHDEAVSAQAKDRLARLPRQK
ncbi:MAG TPA: tetratricopeptide repeat protein [Myxococcales bacterium]|nr:tetratricopeptide repeat protein [Myxococcales bacterium]